MKIAGRKNDGAWYRTNAAIRDLNASDRASFASALNEAVGAKAGAALADIQSLAAECGVTLPEKISNAEQWLSDFALNGIPRQVWNGRLSFTTYAKVGNKYVANYQSQIHFMAKDLRRFCKNWIHGRNAMADLGNATDSGSHNPGGLPNALQNT